MVSDERIGAAISEEQLFLSGVVQLPVAVPDRAQIFCLRLRQIWWVRCSISAGSDLAIFPISD